MWGFIATVALQDLVETHMTTEIRGKQQFQDEKLRKLRSMKITVRLPLT